MHSALFWLLLNIFSIIMLSFYSMLEMACVSFNKVRLQYYVSSGVKRAEWLNWLLHNPTRLFGTTLIGVNVATFFGSEFAREFHAALGIDPDWSPLSQVLLVVIFGELAPMFAARRYAEHVAMLGVPLVYGSAKALTPIVWGLSLITKLCGKIIGGKEAGSNIFLTREELQKILEEHDEERPATESEEFNVVTANIFKLSIQNVRQMMEPMTALPKVPSNATIAQVGNILARSDTDYVAVYHREITNIVGIVYAKDLLRHNENRRVRDFATPPWFVTQNTNLLQILSQFSRNNETVGVILDQQGRAEGFLRMEELIEELFGTGELPTVQGEGVLTEPVTRYIECTVPGLMRVGDFNARFNVVLDSREELTLSELIAEELGHHPEIGESIYLEPFELVVEATTLTGVKSVQVTTHMS